MKEYSERQKSKFKESYEQIKDELGLTGNRIEDIHTLVEECNKLQGEICVAADTIKIDDLATANEYAPELTKQAYVEFVKYAVSKKNGKLSEKQQDKYNEHLNKQKLDLGYRQSFFNTFIESDNLDVIDLDVNVARETPTTSEEFSELIDKSAKTREYINSVLYGRYRILQRAAIYISGFRLSPADFKIMVDMEYYKGGYPKEDSDPYIISAFRRFYRIYKLLHDYQFNLGENTTKLFGFDVHIENEDFDFDSLSDEDYVDLFDF